MQFSLLNFLIGLPQLNALANGANGATGDQSKKPDNDFFSALLADPNAATDNSDKNQQQAEGELPQELVSNLVVAQEASDTSYKGHESYVANIQGILNRKISPQRATDILEHFDTSTNDNPPPEVLKDILENVEAGNDPVSVQDILSQVASSEPDAAPDQRANTLQRALQWLQNALAPAPMEALAFANAANMFPEAQTDQVSATERVKEKSKPKEDSVVMPSWVQNIGEQDVKTEKTSITTTTLSEAALPEVELPAVDDAPILVATKHNQPTHASNSENKPDSFDALVSQLSKDSDASSDVETAPVTQHTDKDTATAVQTTHSQHTDTRNTETVRIHHANFAYARSEVMDQVKVGVTQAVRDGVDRITIQLNPTDLGRVEVKMDIVADGMSQVSFLVDKQETFDLLQRDARTLERMLQDAGIQADAGSMQFNLRQESQSKEPWAEEANGSDTTEEIEASNITSRDLPTQMYVHLISDRVDITA